MGLRINTNVAALNAQRNLYNTTSGLNSTLERLSTGLRINRAADDAAGMAISEGLTSQLRGLKQVVRNTEDAISMVSTAESAIAEQVAISQRMRELSVQAANGAISDYDRANIQKEVDQLLAEFDRIATQTSFNGVALLNGQFGTKDLQVGTEKGQTIRLNLRVEQGFHDWVIDEFNAAIRQLQVGESDSVEFVADQAGSFEFYCSVGSHRQMGMVGRLIVE